MGKHVQEPADPEQEGVVQRARDETAIAALSDITVASTRKGLERRDAPRPFMSHQAFDVLFSHLCSSQDCQLAFCWLARCRTVCRPWCEAVRHFLPTLHVLDFQGHEARVRGEDVLCALKHVTGTGLNTLDLGGCSRLSGRFLEEILRVVHDSCRSVQTNVTGCQGEVQLRAAAVSAQFHFGCASPRALFEHLKAVKEGASCYQWDDLCAILLPRLKLDPSLDPGADALLDAAMHASAWDVALLLSVSFLVGDQGQTRTFDCDEVDANYRRPVHLALERGDEAMMAVLVCARADLGPVRFDWQRTPLLMAASTAGQIKISQIIVESGADISAADWQGNTALTAAIAAGHVTIAKMLMQNGAVISCRSGFKQQGAELLLQECVARRFELAQILVEAKADISATDRQGNTPLMAAFKRGQATLAQMLVQRGATVPASNQQGTKLLLAAITVGNVQLAQVLMKAGVNISATDRQGTTPLIAACAAGHMTLVQILLEAKSDISATDRQGRTPLLVACAAGHPTIVKMLLQKGAVLAASNRPALSKLLLKASAAGQNELAELLVEAKADISFTDWQGATPLLAAIAAGHLALAHMLVQKTGAVVSAYRPGATLMLSGVKLLLQACAAGHIVLTQLPVEVTASIADSSHQVGCRYLVLARRLVQEGVVITDDNMQGGQLLLSVCEAGHIELVQILVDAGVNISATNSLGATPLLVVAGHLALTKMLVQKGANVKTTRRDGAGFLSLSIVSQNEEVIQFAFKHGPRRFKGQGTANSADDVAQLTQCFMDPRKIEGWLRDGASPSGLICEIGALLSSAAVDQPVQDQLNNVRALIDHHKDFLCDPSQWPVAHCMQQLASQETASTFLPALTTVQTCVHLEKAPDRHAIIEWVNKPQPLIELSIKFFQLKPDGHTKM